MLGGAGAGGRGRDGEVVVPRGGYLDSWEESIS